MTGSGAPAAEGGYIVQPVRKALLVLDLVAQSGREMTLTEVAGALGIPKTTTFRYLHTLAVAGFLDHDRERDRYRIGARFRSLAAADDSLRNLVALARPVMTALRAQLNETINLGILAGSEIVYVDMIVADRALRMQARIGQRHPLHSTALGKAILAFLPEPERDALLAGPLVEMTARTLTDRELLLRQLRRARSAYFATEVEENEDGAMCIGVPILDSRQYPVASISVSAPKLRMGRRRSNEAAQQLVAAARDLSARLGGRIP